MHTFAGREYLLYFSGLIYDWMIYSYWLVWFGCLPAKTVAVRSPGPSRVVLAVAPWHTISYTKINVCKIVQSFASQMHRTSSLFQAGIRRAFAVRADLLYNLEQNKANLLCSLYANTNLKLPDKDISINPNSRNKRSINNSIQNFILNQWPMLYWNTAVWSISMVQSCGKPISPDLSSDGAIFSFLNTYLELEMQNKIKRNKTEDKMSKLPLKFDISLIFWISYINDWQIHGRNWEICRILKQMILVLEVAELVTLLQPRVEIKKENMMRENVVWGQKLGWTLQEFCKENSRDPSTFIQLPGDTNKRKRGCKDCKELVM